jgi:5-methylcytosine-specific restriction endonuclease McrA
LDKIRDFYINCPKGMTVDHIIPLQGTIVSGLHVLSNLQYLTREENSRKNNKFKGI